MTSIKVNLFPATTTQASPRLTKRLTATSATKPAADKKQASAKSTAAKTNAPASGTAIHEETMLRIVRKPPAKKPLVLVKKKAPQEVYCGYCYLFFSLAEPKKRVGTQTFHPKCLKLHKPQPRQMWLF